MDEKKYAHMHLDKGFIAAMDQSGGSSPQSLKNYGIPESAYHSEKEMFDLMHSMRTRIITSPCFSGEHILGAILFEGTMERKIEGQYTGDYLWEKKGICSFLNIDKNMLDEKDHVRLMKNIPHLEDTLRHAYEDRHIFGTKERSVINDYDPNGIAAIVDQQFELAKKVNDAGLVPIVEPEVGIHTPNREKSEKCLHDLIKKYLEQANESFRMILKISIPVNENLYLDLMNDPHICRIAALSGGYSREEAVSLLTKNKGLIASFSRALTQGLNVNQTDEEFANTLSNSINEIYNASIR